MAMKLKGASLVAQMVVSACNAGDPGSIPGSGRSPGEGNGNTLQYSCLKISWTEEPGRLQSMRLQKSRRRLGDSTTTNQGNAHAIKLPESLKNLVGEQTIRK